MMLFAIQHIMKEENLTEEEACNKVFEMVKTEEGLINFVETFSPMFIEEAEKFAQEFQDEV